MEEGPVLKDEQLQVHVQVCRGDGSPTYCVTGATGYIGSWLVKSLLQRGYSVHATVRDPVSGKQDLLLYPVLINSQITEKVSHLLSSWNGGDRLKVFRADFQEEGSFNEAVEGCHGVFHVAASMEFGLSAKEDVESYVRTKILKPAIKGTLNLLQACLRTKSVKRVIFTSSISTITAKDKAGRWKSTVDESCQNSVDHVWNMKASGWVYVLSKLLSEDAAFKFANEKGIDLVSILPTTVAGPFFTPSVPASVQVLLSPITGDPVLYPILSAVHSRLGSISVVHIDDVCNAHIFLMEQPAAKGRYICSAHSCVMSDLVDHLALECPWLNITRSCEVANGVIPSEISSKKLTGLGFEYKYSPEEIIRHSVSSCLQHGFISRPGHKQC